MLAIVTVALLLAACSGDEQPDEVADDTEEVVDDPAGEAADDDGPDDEATDDDAATEEDQAADDAEGPVGSVTLDGQTVDLEEALWCEDYTSAAGETEMRIVGIAHGAIKLDAGAYVTDDGALIDAVTIWENETLDRGLGGTQVVAIEEGEDGHPWIAVDGREVTIDGSYLGEDDPDDVEEAVFSAELTIEDEPRGSAFC